MPATTRRRRRRPTTIAAVKREELVGFYREALGRIVGQISDSGVLDSSRPRLAGLLRETGAVLNELDRKSGEWAAREIEALYRGNLAFIDAQIRAKNFGGFFPVEEAYSLIHQDIVRELVTNESFGLGPRLRQVTEKMRSDLRKFASASRQLRGELRNFNRILAHGALQGAPPAAIRNEILESIMGKRTPTWMALQRFQGGTGVGGALQTLAESPWLVKSNGSKYHIFDHVQTTVITRESEARNRARAERLVERGIELAQISSNPPVTPDACALYAGRIVALTPETARATGYPLVDRLPDGGPPFHPNCTHSMRGWFGDLEDEEDQAIAEETGPGGGKTVRGGIPESALDRPWGEIQKDVRRKGFEAIVTQNPQVARANLPTSASAEVRSAIDGARRKLRDAPPPPRPVKPEVEVKKEPKAARRPKREARKPASKVPPPVSSVEPYQESEIKEILSSGKPLDYSRVGFVRENSLAGRVALNEMVDEGLFGPKTKVRKFLVDNGYFDERGLDVETFARDLRLDLFAAKTSRGIAAGELREKFIESVGVSSSEVLDPSRFKAKLRELNGAPTALHAETKRNFRQAHKRSRNYGFSDWEKTGKSFEEFVDSIHPSLLTVKHSEIKWRFSRKHGRAFAKKGANEIQIYATNYEHGGSAPVHVHEFAHHLEYRNERGFERFRSFLEERARASNWRLVSIHARAREIGFDDNFMDAYVGRVYRFDYRVARERLLEEGVHATEVLTMGAEAFESRASLNQILAQDPEHFGIVWAFLRGY